MAGGGLLGACSASRQRCRFRMGLQAIPGAREGLRYGSGGAHRWLLPCCNRSRCWFAEGSLCPCAQDVALLTKVRAQAEGVVDRSVRPARQTGRPGTTHGLGLYQGLQLLDCRPSSPDGALHKLATISLGISLWGWKMRMWAVRPNDGFLRFAFCSSTQAARDSCERKIGQGRQYLEAPAALARWSTRGIPMFSCLMPSIAHPATATQPTAGFHFLPLAARVGSHTLKSSSSAAVFWRSDISGKEILPCSPVSWLLPRIGSSPGRTPHPGRNSSFGSSALHFLVLQTIATAIELCLSLARGQHRPGIVSRSPCHSPFLSTRICKGDGGFAV